MRISIWLTMSGLLLAGCSATGTSADGKTTQAVVAAFLSEHPYSKMDDAKEQQAKDGSEQYVLAYTRADGTKGQAVYTPDGVIVSDQ